MNILRDFVKSFPTATIIYLLLVLFTELRFDWFWLLFAVIIDVLDDIISNV